MRIDAVELRRVELPIVAPLRTSFGVEAVKHALLVRVFTEDGEGWGECVADPAPRYSAEYTDGAQQVIERFLLPILFAAGGPSTGGLSAGRLSAGGLTAARVAPLLAPIKGHPMAKAAVEMAVLDAELRAAGQSFATRLGGVRDRVPSGVSVGIMDDLGQLIDAVDGYVEAGYLRIKLKIQPGWDVEPVRAVRERHGPDLLLQVDANTAYTLGDARQLARLDGFDLLLLEQPLPEDDLRGHAELAHRVRTPICLDESVTSARAAADAIALEACQIINIKPGRVGGYLEARKVAAVAAANGVPVWCGGMLETGIGRAANVALAAGPEFTLPGDVSASGRFYARDITEPIVLEDGHVRVPTGPGIGVTVDLDVLDEVTVARTTVRP